MFYRLAILAAHSSNSVVGANIVLRRAATTDLVQNSRRYVQNIHSPLGSITVSIIHRQREPDDLPKHCGAYCGAFISNDERFVGIAFKVRSSVFSLLA